MNKKTQLYVTFAVIVCLIVSAAIYYAKPFKSTGGKRDKIYENVSEPLLGTYDRREKISVNQLDSLRHFVIEWNDYKEDTSVNKQLLEIFKEKQNIVVTIKMSSKRGEANSRHGVLQGMVAGDYDKKIIGLCNEISTSRNTIFLRWNPEMEVPVKQYQWQSQSSNLYIKAFRHFAALCRRTAPTAKIVWGPLGYAGVLEYFPGADLVDIASITLNKLPEPLSLKYPQENSVPIQIKRKLHRLRFIDKPVFIFGSEEVKKESFNNHCITAAIEDIRKDTGIIYSSKNFERQENADSKVNANFEIGVYDPKQQLTDAQAVSTEHLFANFGSLKDGTFKKDFDDVISRNHNIIVTMEPWKDKNLEKDSDVLIHTINGRYDAEIKELYAIISSVKQTVYLRWGHEMEIPINRYPWQSKDPVIYIKAFRYFMNFNHSAKNIYRVWGPTGDRGALDFWPGNDAVDYISLAIYGLPDKDITDYNMQESFSTIFRRKYNRLLLVNKPIFITEFGVKGSQSYKRKWLDDAAATINTNPQIAGVNYFNFKDSPKAWGKIEPPDWSITKETFLHFTEQIKDKRLK